ncbi:acid ceramidase-like [Diadema setosum]|uniref:acid ceramidase-like n=1 Tax=Diadema setosum TaxID=31175 RepID=UPI003B3ABD64
MWYFLVLVSLFVLSGPGLAQDLPPFTEDCRTDAYPPPIKDKVQTYVLNLDMAPEDRWTGLVKSKTDEMNNLIQDIKDLVGIFINETEAVKYLDELMAPLADTFPSPYDMELKGIANATGIPLGQIVLYNVFYEVFTVCTSIVAEDKSGDLFQARNLDFGLFLGWDTKNKTWALTERLRPLITNVDYQQGGKTVAKGVHFAGYVGVITGMKPGILGLSMNERFQLDGGFIGIIEWVLGQRDGQWMGFVLRDAVIKATDYHSTLAYLTSVKLLAPGYIILGGNSTGEGAIITRSVGTKADNVKLMNPSNGTWYLVETNYDNWESPPFFDDRRTPATKCMDKMTQTNVGFKGIYNVLSTKPVRNLLTTYTALMHVRDGTLDTYIRYCPQPCFPW